MSTSQESSVRKPVRSFRLKRKEGTGEEKDNSSSSKIPPSSEATQCTICQGDVVNRCCSNSCSHQFCFECLKKWSEVKAECPLCKTRFRSIYHNFRSRTDADDNEHDEYVVPRPTTPTIHLPYFLMQQSNITATAPTPVNDAATLEFDNFFSIVVELSRPRLRSIEPNNGPQVRIISPPPEPDALNSRMPRTRARGDTLPREETQPRQETRPREETHPRQETRPRVGTRVREETQPRQGTRRSSRLNQPYTLRRKTPEQPKPSK